MLLNHNFITSYSLDDVHLLGTIDTSRHPIFESNKDYVVEVEQILNAIVTKAGQRLGQTNEYSFDVDRCAKLASTLRIDEGYVLELCHRIWK